MGDRGVRLDRTYQLNTGGNTDFLNMLEHDRLKSKKISKTESVQSQLDVRLAPENIHIGPSEVSTRAKRTDLRAIPEGWHARATIGDR